MRRSSLVVLAAALVGTFLTALPATAAMNANVEAPTHGQEITKDAPVQARVLLERLASDPAVTSVAVQLFRDGTHYSRTPLRCASNDGCTSSSQTWVGQFDPQPQPIRNGMYNLQVKVNDGTFADKINVYLSLPPSPVTNLQASPQGRAVELAWKKAPEPDISGYRVERRTGETWERVTRLGPEATSYTDRPPAGTYSYRVVSVRKNGKQDAELTAASGASKSTVVAPPKEPTTSAPTKPDAPASTQGGNAGAGSEPDVAAGSTGRGSGRAEGARGGSGAGPRVTRGPVAGSVPPPPPARRDFSFSLRSLGQVFGFQPQDEAEGGEEGYFGEGEGFSEELDYSGIDPVTGEPIAVPVRDTGLQGVLISQLINRPLLVSLAIGLLLVLLAVFILRWIRRSPVPTPGPGNSPAASETPLPWLRRFLRATGEPETSKQVPSPTATPLSRRAPTQARPVTRPVRGPNAAVTTNGRPTDTSPPERRPARQSATAPIFAGEAETRPASRGEGGSGASDLFPQRRSPASPPSARDQSGSDTGTETVRVLRPEPSSRGAGRRVR
ncbi:MAG: hypothetical protein M3N32_01385 [Actinomycetota bacterium]|nr:hypothetical protein [Actinomycetota bacterium]